MLGHSAPAAFRRVLLVGAALLAAACATPGAPPPAPGDCAVVRVWSNGWHTALALPASALGENHPALSLFPEARYFLIGWGERNFYRDPSPGFFDGLGAILPPSRSTMMIIAADEPVETRIWPGREVVDVAVSRAGLARLSAEIADSLVKGEDGAPMVIGEGRVPGSSVFVESRPGFHLLRMCNHWTAARLNAAGVRVEPRLAFHAPWLTGALHRKAPQHCPAARED